MIRVFHKFGITIGFLLLPFNSGTSQTGIVYDQLNRLTNIDLGNGRTVTYNYDVAGNRTSQVVVLPSVGPIRVSLKAFLEGPFNTSTNQMNTTLNTSGLLTSHFSGASIPADAVDSVNIEIRSSVGALVRPAVSKKLDIAHPQEKKALADVSKEISVDERIVPIKTNPQSLDNPTTTEQHPAWLMMDGTIRDFADLTKSYVEFSPPPGNFYVVVRHRNHLAIMTANAVALNNSTPSQPYDFTSAQTQAYGTNPMKLVGTKYCMYSGDANSSNIISASDATAVFGQLNVTGYLNTDMNLNGIISVADANMIFGNLNKASQVPGASMQVSIPRKNKTAK